jgi:hypothetical protein
MIGKGGSHADTRSQNGNGYMTASAEVKTSIHRTGPLVEKWPATD